MHLGQIISILAWEEAVAKDYWLKPQDGAPAQPQSKLPNYIGICASPKSSFIYSTKFCLAYAMCSFLWTQEGNISQSISRETDGKMETI